VIFMNRALPGEGRSSLMRKCRFEIARSHRLLSRVPLLPSLSLSLSLSFLVRLGSSRGTSPAESSLHASANRETKKSATRSLYTSERASAEFLSGRPACASLPTSRPPR